ERMLLTGVLVEEQVQLVERRSGHLPMVLFIEIPQRDRVREELVEMLHAFTTDAFRQRDWQPHETSIRLDLGCMLMHQRRRVLYDVPVDSFHAHGAPLIASRSLDDPACVPSCQVPSSYAGGKRGRCSQQHSRSWLLSACCVRQE